ncbi:Sugar kinase of the NBD/HSP70 family, may contain an N-terminal HTH domain [Paenibacillus catalpae]|uniref:Sugar kinase of the NBD/HSP70 family, may contain an N-terminal HTH domain n=1 Tax=Paenibacillus catalpae TaxID=1045775 RepID=A0A1I2BDB7_9BACL|nr:ROK family protein [Paenibacillus catalpae]SFE54154.1 Sugar kinase of the NBD/HSP70 family, may contain an N-terminal HTH domain [Paenibacillus catalpae]
MITGDASYIKKMNRSLILKEILKEGMLSRADVSKATALTRATVSGQVADLLDEELVVEKEIEYNLVGRKPIMLSVNAEAGYAIGIDLEFDQISFAISNLQGSLVQSETMKLQATSYPDILSLLIAQIKHYQEGFAASRYGIIGIVIAIHGLVSTDEVIHYIPSFDWHDVPLKNDLEKALGLEVKLENNANLSAFAERVFFHHETDDLLSVTLYSGIGMGMMINHSFFRGQDGFAGEIGHMIVVPGGQPCNCGNKGCWEKYASETSVFQILRANKPEAEITYEQIERWIKDKDPEVTSVMEQFMYYLSIGLNNIINIYNPEVVVLDSELLRIYPDSLRAIESNLNSRVSHYREIKLSTIGKKSCSLGACAIAIQNFLQVPVLNLPYKG